MPMDPNTFGRLHVKIAQTNKCWKQTNLGLMKERKAGGHFQIMRDASCLMPTEPKRTIIGLCGVDFLLTRINNCSHLSAKARGHAENEWHWLRFHALMALSS